MAKRTKAQCRAEMKTWMKSMDRKRWQGWRGPAVQLIAALTRMLRRTTAPRDTLPYGTLQHQLEGMLGTVKRIRKKRKG